MIIFLINIDFYLTFTLYFQASTVKTNRPLVSVGGIAAGKLSAVAADKVGVVPARRILQETPVSPNQKFH